MYKACHNLTFNFRYFLDYRSISATFFLYPKMSGFKQLAAGMSQKRIDSPLAKYSSSGQLSCIICNQVVKSELLWNAHLNSKTHLNNKSQMKMQLVGQTAKPLSNLQTEPQTNKKPVVRFLKLVIYFHKYQLSQ